jgi:hypothetical protein
MGLVQEALDVGLRNVDGLLGVDLVNDRVVSVKRLLAARSRIRSPSTATVILALSGNDLQISSSLRPGTVIAPSAVDLMAA